MSALRLTFLGFSAISGLGLTPAQATVNGFGDQVASIGYFAAGSGAGFDDPQSAMTVADSNSSGATMNAIAPAAGGPSAAAQGTPAPAAGLDKAKIGVQK